MQAFFSACFLDVPTGFSTVMETFTLRRTRFHLLPVMNIYGTGNENMKQEKPACPLWATV